MVNVNALAISYKKPCGMYSICLFHIFKFMLKREGQELVIARLSTDHSSIALIIHMDIKRMRDKGGDGKHVTVNI